MRDTELLRRNAAINTDHTSRAVTQWLEKRIKGSMRQNMKELADQLRAEQAKFSTGRG